MLKLGYFPVDPQKHWGMGRWPFADNSGHVLGHKRSPHYFRDVILPLPVVPISREYFSREAAMAATRIEAVRSSGDLRTLQGHQWRLEGLVKANWRAVANRNDQFVLSKDLLTHLANEVRMPAEFFFHLCPLEPRWQSGHNFDVLNDEWPDAMLLACPPDTLTSAAMARTVVEYLEGKDIIFVGQEHLLDGPLERTFVRRLALKKHIGSPVMEPYRSQAFRSFAVYMFLQPATLTRIEIQKGLIPDFTY